MMITTATVPVPLDARRLLPSKIEMEITGLVNSGLFSLLLIELERIFYSIKSTLSSSPRCLSRKSRNGTEKTLGENRRTKNKRKNGDS